MIDYKTYDEQLDILKEKGMSIENDSETKLTLKINNYYNLINAYKDLFIEERVTPERFKKGISFSEIAALHNFDKNLRALISNSLITIERTLKSIVAHEFAKNHGNHDIDYLNVDNFDQTIMIKKDGHDISLATDIILKLNRDLIYSIEKGDPMICHYKTKYNRVPLWVFINKITFGDLSKFFAILLHSDKDAISKSLKEVSNVQTSSKIVRNSIKILVLLRNQTAHDQKIYDFNSKPISASSKIPFLEPYKLSNTQTFFCAIGCMSIFLKEKVFFSFIIQLQELLRQLFSQIHSIPTNAILNKMGIPYQFLSEDFSSKVNNGR